MSDKKLVWSDDHGDLRKKDSNKSQGRTKSGSVNESSLMLEIRRLTSGKGRTVVEIKGLPSNKDWCKTLAKDLKKTLGVGGSYKNNYIELHGEKIDQVGAVLDKRSLKWKKTGG